MNISISHIIQKELQDEVLTSDEQALLNTWLEASPENRSVYDRLSAAEGLQEELQRRVKAEESAGAMLQVFTDRYFNVPEAGQTHRVRLLTRSWFRYAAVILLLVGGAATWWLMKMPAPATTDNDRQHLSKDAAPGGNKAVLTLADGSKIVLDSTAKGYITSQGDTKIDKPDNGRLTYTADKDLPESSLYNTVSTPRGGQYQVVLPDGSEVWLNAASSIRFPTRFAGTERKVVVTGEVYVEVAKDSKRPFSVHVKGATIEVLGTSLDVNAYEDEEAMKATLVSGSVRVSAIGTTGKSVVLKPGQQAGITHSAQLSTHTADIDQTLAWKNGLFQFDRAPLSDVLRQLSRWYDVDIVYEKDIPGIKFWGKMKRDLNLSQVLEGLGELGVKFKIEGKKLIVLQSGSDNR